MGAQPSLAGVDSGSTPRLPVPLHTPQRGVWMATEKCVSSHFSWSEELGS
jgi:hypothetical protein